MELARDVRDPDRVAILLPGMGYTATMPLLYYARMTLAELGWTTIAVSWEPPADDHARWVVDRLAEIDGGTGTTLVVGKSLGSLAALATTGPAIWLTPLMTAIADAVRESTAPALLVGGTVDRLWDGPAARGTGKEVLEIDGADHGLEISGSVERSVDTLGEVVAAVSAFARQLG